MEIVSHIESLEALNKPIALTIGTFDGLHLGHQEIFKKMKSLTQSKGGSMIMVSFVSHPLENIQKGTIVPKIISLEEKIALLRAFGFKTLVLLEFNDSLRELSYQQFMQKILKQTSIDYLVLGDGAVFGSGKKGDEKALHAFGDTHGFKCFYLEKFTLDHEIISSKKIRNAIKLGDMEKVRKYLGRPYALYAPLHLKKLQDAGVHLLKISYGFNNHCELPSGDYIVRLEAGKYSKKALAHVTTLSTANENREINLEIYLTESFSEFMNDQVKVELLTKLNEEQLTDFTQNLVDRLSKLNEFEPPQNAS